MCARTVTFALAFAIATIAHFALASTAHAQTEMSGTYTINGAQATSYVPGTAGGNFNTVGLAFDALEVDGIDGATTFNIFDDGGAYVSNADYGLGCDDIAIFSRPVSGMGSFPIVFQAAPGEFPVISGAGYNTGSLDDDVTCYINCPNNVVFDGITFTGGIDACLLIGVQFAPSTAAQNLTIRRCTFSGCTGGAGLLVHGGGGAPLSNVLIEHNFLFGNAGFGGTGSAPSSARASLGLFNYSSTVLVRHNTVLHTSTTATTGAIGMPDPGNNLGDLSYNCFVVTGSGRPCINDHSNGQPPLVADRNVYYYAPGALFHRNTPFYPDLATWQSSTGLDANSVNTNPNLNNITPGSENLHLTINSENCVEKAIGSTATIDRDGDTRPFGGNRDIGADETTLLVREIDVQRPAGTTILDGGTDAHGVLVAGVTLPVTYTIASFGNTALNVSSPTFSAQSNVTVAINTAPPASVASGATATFVLDIQPIQAGAWSFDLSMVNDDGNENPYNFTVSGTCDGPEMDVERPTGTPVLDGGTDNVGSSFGTFVPTDIVYRIDNDFGNQTLTISVGSIVVTPVSACTVIVQTPPSASVAVAAFTNMTVRVTPTAPGAFSFTVSIPNNDGNENPYNFTVNGTSSPTPAEIQIERPLGTVVPDGGGDPITTPVQAGAPTLLTYTIRNVGGTTLNITPPITVTPTLNCTAFAQTQPGATVAPAGQTTFVISVTPTAAGSFSYIVSIVNDDANENPYNFAASGNATAAEMDLFRSGVPKADGGTDNVGAMTAATATPITYTIINNGAATLTITTPITVTPVTNCGVVVTLQPATAVPAGNNTTFTVSITPTASGPFQFTFSIDNNDANENPYNLTVNGTGLAPEIDVQRPASTSIPDGGTDNIGTIPTGSATSFTYFILNQGNMTLSVTVPITLGTFSNCNASVTTQPSPSIGPSSSSTLVIGVTPTGPGAFSYAITIGNDDPNESPYNITVTGSGSGAPEIDVQRPAGTSIADGGTDTLPGSFLAGAPTPVTYTIANQGTAPLGISVPISVSPISNCGVSVSQQPGTSVAASGTSTFIVNVTPTAAGPFSFNISITNTDANENPYNFTVSGTGVAPDMDLQRPAGTSKPDGGIDALGNVLAGSSTPFTYTIANTGGATLTITLPVNVTPVSNCSVSIGTPPAASVPASGSTTFSVNVQPTAAGAFSFTLSITNDDPDENPYNITVNGTGVAPDMDLQRPAGTSKPDGSTDSLGNLTAGSATPFTYTIANTGGATLTITLPVNVTPVTNCSVSIGTSPGTSVAASSSTTFSVNVTPTASGAFSFTLSITNNDPDENPYDITVTGTGQSPEIDVQRPFGTSIADGGTDNVGTIPTGTPSPISWVIVNQGNQALTITLPVNVTPVSNCAASVTTAPSPSVGPSGNTTLTISVTPTSAGAFSFTIAITNSDLNENPYNITVNGTGASTPAEIDVQRPALTSIPDGGTDTLPGSFVAGAPTPVTYTIENQGGSALGITVPITATAGTNCSVVVTTQPPASVAALSSATFVVSVTATAAGAFTFGITITNTDSNENPYNFTVNGTGAAPDMDLQRPAGTSKVDGGSDSLGNVIAGAPTVFMYTIENTGGATLTLTLPVNVTPISNCSVSIGTPPGTSVAAATTTTFTVSVTPTAAGAFSFDLSIDNNDPDENPYNITVNGTGTAPEIDLQRPAGSSIPVASTDNLGNVPAGSASPFTYTIRNFGTANLTLVLPVNVTPGANCNVSVSTQPSSPVTPSGTATFVVDVTPTAGGAFDFNVSITNNDPNENPYTFTVVGVGTVLPPEIDVQRPVTTSVPDGGNDPLGSRLAGSPTALTYTIANTGGSTLNITSTVTATAGANCTASVTTQPGATVAPGGSTTFIVTFTPTIAGAFDYGVTFNNNDPNENPYNFTATGTAFVTGPEMEIQRPAGTLVADGGADALPNVTAGTPTDFTYVVENFGNAGLTMTTPITVTATGNCTASATVQPSSPVSAGNMTTFTVRVTASALGAFSFAVSIANNDADENPYNFTASGTADAPEIDVQRPAGASIASGGGDSLGTVAFGSNINVTYTIENLGTLPLSITTPIFVNANSNCTVNVSTQPATSVAAGGTTTFIVVLNVTGAGAFSYGVSITNDDLDENPYAFTATGSGATVPEIDLQRPAGASIADSGVDGVGNVSVIGGTSLTYTIENQGSAALNLTGLPLVSIINTFNCVVTVLADPVTPVAASATTTFTLSVTAVGPGPLSFQLVIANNDADEGMYTVTVFGDGVVATSGGGGGCGLTSVSADGDVLPLWLLLAGMAVVAFAYRRARA